MHAVGVIPARYRSTRFPGKPLALIDGKALVLRVLERARTAGRLDKLLVATDDERIASAVVAWGGEVVMTSETHVTGTDRLAEVARLFPADLFVNIQGDEPLVDPRDIDGLVECLDADPACDMATLCEPLRDARAARDPNVVKVVCDASGRALYFSRSAIPFHRQPESEPGCWQHVGLYAYRREFLLRFPTLDPTPAERAEGLEQLRALEHGFKVRCAVIEGWTSASVDVPADIAQVEARIRERS